MKVAIVGFARDGQAAYEYWNRDNNEVAICDQNENAQLPAEAKSNLGSNYLKYLDQYDVIVRTAGLPPRLIAEANPESPDILKKITSNTDEFIRVSPTKNVIGVTGTKGKGTTATLIAKMLEAAGKKVHLGGNIGIASLELLKNNIQPADWVVLELGAFQLVDQKHSPHIGVCVMVEAEHMDWFKDMEEYITAKQQMFVNQKPEDVAIYYADNDNSKHIASVSPGQKIPYMKEPGAFIINDDIAIDETVIVATKDLKLLGKHNWQNVCAAVTAVWQVTQDIAAMQSVLTTFTGLEHRLELVRAIGGVKYYDDSFGTTPETATVAIQAFSQPKVLILGGSTKGSSYNELAKVVAKANIRQVILIGNTSNPDYEAAAPKIESELHDAGVNKITSLIKDGGVNMTEIVQTAKKQAQQGDVVLLSAACASFDMFRDYKDRGDQFKAAVQALS